MSIQKKSTNRSCTRMNEDNDFLKFAAEQEEAAKNRGRSGGGEPREYETIKWSGLETNRMKLFRAVGGVPDGKRGNDCARTFNIAWIVGDDGRKFRFIYPERSEDPNHFIHQIFTRVKQATWVNKKKVLIVQEKFPEIYELVTKNGLHPDDRAYKFDRGWEGRNVLTVQGIDREMMDWHRENKHLVLLSRNISVDKEGREYPDEGVPSYGFVGLLSHLFRHYKSWENYDMGITRTGIMTSPYNIINASYYSLEVPDDLKGLVSKEPLTEEEASWERYDLVKLFPYTSATKFFNRMKGSLAKIDTALGTRFYQDVKALADKEKEKWDSEKEEGGNTATKETETQPEVKVQEAKPTAPTRNVPTKGTSFNTSLLKGWGKLTREEKESIKDVIPGPNGEVNIVYNDAEDLCQCPDCSALSPGSFNVCPSCGLSFTGDEPTMEIPF